jgi:hypothetical protein
VEQEEIITKITQKVLLIHRHVQEVHQIMLVLVVLEVEQHHQH